MFDYMLEVNEDLNAEFKKEINEKDKIFIKEMIVGTDHKDASGKVRH